MKRIHYQDIKQTPNERMEFAKVTMDKRGVQVNDQDDAQKPASKTFLLVTLGVILAVITTVVLLMIF